MKKVNFERRKVLKIGFFSLIMLLFWPVLKLLRKVDKTGFFEDSSDDFIDLKNGFKFKKEGQNVVFYNKEGKKVFTLTQDGEIIVGE